LSKIVKSNNKKIYEALDMLSEKGISIKTKVLLNLMNPHVLYF